MENNNNQTKEIDRNLKSNQIKINSLTLKGWKDYKTNNDQKKPRRGDTKMRETFIPTSKEFHPFGVWWNQNNLSIIISSLRDYNNKSKGSWRNFKFTWTSISSITLKGWKDYKTKNDQKKPRRGDTKMRETFIPTDKEFHPFGVLWNQKHLSIIISSLRGLVESKTFIYNFIIPSGLQ
jgi:uncharacterized protein YifN (PemK superfamily)